MNRENWCQHCGSNLVKCRNPNQHYCPKPDCQRQRENLWRRNKLDTDSDYKSNQNAANRKWRESHKTYWKNYRAKRPNYVIRNREKQRIRDQKNKASNLAKSDALTLKITLITDTSAVATASG